MIRLVAIDLDGTLLNSHGHISQATCETIQKIRAKGIKVVLCTGRPFYSLSSILAQLQLTDTEEYVISFNGALLTAVLKAQPLFQRTLSFADYQELASLGEGLQIGYHAQCQEGIYTSRQTIHPYTAYDSYLNRTPIHCLSPESFQKLAIYKMMFVGEKEQLDAAIARIPSEYSQRFNQMKSMDCFYEFLDRQVSKGQTLGRLAAHLQIDSTEILAIGDNENDLSMMKVSGISVAMGNAEEKIKQYADFVTKTNEDEGVNHSLLQVLKSLEGRI